MFKPRNATLTEKICYFVAFCAVLVAWASGAIGWYWCVLPGLSAINSLVSHKPKDTQAKPKQASPVDAAAQAAAAQKAATAAAENRARLEKSLSYLPANDGTQSNQAAPDSFDETVPGVYTFTYCGSVGETAKERVLIQRSVTGYGARYFAGICMLTQADRTFRLDLIDGAMVSEETGEIFQPAGLWTAFDLASLFKADAAKDTQAPPVDAAATAAANRAWVERLQALIPANDGAVSARPSTGRVGIPDAAGAGKKRRQSKQAAPGSLDSTSPGVYTFTYCNSAGETDERQVLIRRSITGYGTRYFTGICLIAQAGRTFRLDRIVGSMVRAETGENFQPTRLWSAFKRAGLFRADVVFFDNAGTQLGRTRQ